jgi:hypothetical protein
MAKACKVPTKGSDAGKYNFAKTSPVTVLYRKKSYHSMVVTDRAGDHRTPQLHPVFEFGECVLPYPYRRHQNFS